MSEFVEFVQREVACGGCGSLLYVMAPSDAIGRDSASCPACGETITFDYADSDPMASVVAGEEAAF